MKKRSDKKASLEDRLRLAAELARISDDTLHSVVKGAKIEHLDAGGTLWSEGNRPKQLAFVVFGELAVERLRPDGQRKVFRRYGPNRVVGLSTVAGAPHSADIRASVESEVALLPGEFLLADPAFICAAFESLAGVIRTLSDEYQALLYADIGTRVRHYLRDVALTRKEITITQQDFADEIGASRENVTRALSKLANEGTVRLHRGRIEIVDVDALGLRR
jgi:CRP/FNR family transcriptional regulator